ncbi:ABC-F family ATP-binding cassette domain-containing protein [Sunxiuqinia elliptica]|uniref:ATP-binding cassette subfamily F protein uup n=1 Tax=Sunxiuqinia elliptica TaxID=655355 RepID=A0A4R6GWJ4_9BACT|nr:ABC-F family ATP-binding cassette domain-containing protein [Sunxiuqinia elliptica]TDN99806.1 ATP-binding cassette subfamily F protein uup [Sunxiuqinia elliptica]TDO56998.1 ATP-binding cassette subfamily F protein uup [Sunxiuqinia elliptica]
MIPYLQAESISKRYGEQMLFEGISFTIFKDQKVALIAKNGAGKTTLMDIIAGIDTPDEGQVTVTNDIKIGYLKQDPELNDNLTVLQEALRSENPALDVIAQFEAAVNHNDQKAIESLTIKMEELGAWDFDVRVKQVLSQLKITDFDQPVRELSGGQRKRLALANVLVNEPDLLLLDEPTNHLDLDMIEWLEAYLEKTNCTLFMVTHDRYFLDRVCNEIIEIDQNQTYDYRGNYSYYLQKRQERIEQEQASTEKARNLLRTEQEWMRRMPKARSHKAKYRIDQFYELKDKASQRRQEDNLELNMASSRLGKKILELEHISKGYGDLKLITDFSYKFSRFEKVGIVGKNGTGKSTFLNVITKAITPDSGTIDWGQTIQIGYYRQEGIDFKSDEKVIDIVKNIAEVIVFEDGQRMTASQLLTRFLFPPEVQYNFVEKLSGGERRRLYLCTILMQNPNFLILDEPTNDLDIMTLNVLEDYLAAFGGCVVIVSHDRYFMDKIVDHLFVFDGNGTIRDFPGNYTIYRNQVEEEEEQKKKQQQAINQAKPAPEKPKKKSPLKMSFNEKREFEQLEKDIAQLEEEKSQLEEALNSGELTPDELTEKSKRFGVLTDELDEKEMRWLELSEKA